MYMVTWTTCMHTEDKTLTIRTAIDRPINFDTKQYLIVRKENFRLKLKKSGCSLKNRLSFGQKM